jgi:hypothetical protein
VTAPLRCFQAKQKSFMHHFLHKTFLPFCY